MIGHKLFASEPIGNIFYLQAEIFKEIFKYLKSKVAFYNKTTWLLRRGCFNGDT